LFIINSVFSKLLFSTVRIECRLTNGDVSTGTAFFFSYKIDESRHLPLLVTNKHVVAGAKMGQFHVHETVTTAAGETGPAPTSFAVTLPNFEQAWFSHPDINVDICVMPFEPLRQQAETQGKIVFNIPLTEEIIPDQIHSITCLPLKMSSWLGIQSDCGILLITFRYCGAG